MSNCMSYDGTLPCRSTCTLEVGTQLEAFADAALRVRGERLLDVLHPDPPRTVLTLPEQPVDEHLRRETSGVLTTC